jgi:hypothetical protein
MEKNVQGKGKVSGAEYAGVSCTFHYQAIKKSMPEKKYGMNGSGLQRGIAL